MRDPALGTRHWEWDTLHWAPGIWHWASKPGTQYWKLGTQHWECGILLCNIQKQEWGAQHWALDNGNRTSCNGYLAPGIGHWGPYTGHPDLAPSTENWQWALPALGIWHPALGIWHQQSGLGTWNWAARRGTQYQELHTQYWAFGTGNRASRTGHPVLGSGNGTSCKSWPIPGTKHQESCSGHWAPETGHLELGTLCLHWELGIKHQAPIWHQAPQSAHWEPVPVTGSQFLGAPSWFPDIPGAVGSGGNRAGTGEPARGISCHRSQVPGSGYWEPRVGDWVSRAGHWDTLHCEPGVPYWEFGCVPVGSQHWDWLPQIGHQCPEMHLNGSGCLVWYSWTALSSQYGMARQDWECVPSRAQVGDTGCPV